MIQKDFILRWAEELAKVLAQLLGKDPEEGIELTEKALISLLDIDTSCIKATAKDNLIETLTKEKGLNVPQLEFLAEILAKQGELLYAKEQLVETKDKFEKALIIFEYIEKEQQLFSFERVAKVNHIKETIKQL